MLIKNFNYNNVILASYLNLSITEYTGTLIIDILDLLSLLPLGLCAYRDVELSGQPLDSEYSDETRGQQSG